MSRSNGSAEPAPARRRHSKTSPVVEATRIPSSTPTVECSPARERTASGPLYHSSARPPSAQA